MITTRRVLVFLYLITICLNINYALANSIVSFSVSEIETNEVMISAPIDYCIDSQLLPNGNIALHLIVQDDFAVDGKNFWADKVYIVDNSGKILFNNTLTLHSEEQLAETELNVQFVLKKDTLVYETYQDTKHSSYFWTERTWNGDKVDFSRDPVFLPTSERYITENHFPFRMDHYTMAEGEKGFVKLHHLISETSLQLPAGGIFYTVQPYAFYVIEQELENSFRILVIDENCRVVCECTFPIANEEERIAAIIQDKNDALILSVIENETDNVWHVYRMNLQDYSICKLEWTWHIFPSEGEGTTSLIPIAHINNHLLFAENIWKINNFIDGRIISIDRNGTVQEVVDAEMGIIQINVDEEKGQITLWGYDLPNKKCIMQKYSVN